jgi:hypothetical protein
MGRAPRSLPCRRKGSHDMKMKYLLCLFSMLSTAAGAENATRSTVISKPLEGEYSIYAGELHDEKAPTKTDRKLAVEIGGQAAKEIFDSLYPDSKVSCTGEQGERLRRKDQIWCSFTPKDGYRCFLGLDLRTGKSVPGGSC